MVGTAGFEPATPASRTLCSTRLSHVPTSKEAIYLNVCPAVVNPKQNLNGLAIKRIGHNHRFVSSRPNGDDINGCFGQRLNFRQIVPGVLG